MLNTLIIKPCFSTGNIGDAALIKTIKLLFKGKKYFMPNSKKELDSINIKQYHCLIYFGNDCIPYYPNAIPKSRITNFLSNQKKVHIINTSWGNSPSKAKSPMEGDNFMVHSSRPRTYDGANSGRTRPVQMDSTNHERFYRPAAPSQYGGSPKPHRNFEESI